MKEKEQIQNNNGVSKAIIIAVGLLLLLSACGNITKMVFGPVVREVSREFENEFEEEFARELEREFGSMEMEFDDMERELELLEDELDAIELEGSDIEVTIQKEIIQGIKEEIKQEIEAEAGR